MSITELRKLGFNTGDYILVPNYEYTDEDFDAESKSYHFYIGQIVKKYGEYHLDGYMVRAGNAFRFRNPHSTMDNVRDTEMRNSVIQPIFQRVSHICPYDKCPIVKIDKAFYESFVEKTTHLADTVFDTYLNTLKNQKKIIKHE